MRNNLFGAAILLLATVGCQSGVSSSPPTHFYAYRITQYYGSGDTYAIKDAYLTDEFTREFGGWVSFKREDGRKVWLIGTLKVEEGPFYRN